MIHHSAKRIRARMLGFTLLELLAAITIVSVLVGISIAAFSSVGGASRIRGSIIELRSTLRFARMHAISNNEAVHVLFYGDGFSQKDSGTRSKLYRNKRDNFKYLKAYVCFAATKNEFVSDWHSLPDGLIFDPYFTDPSASGNRRLFELAARKPISDYPGFGPKSNPNPASKPHFHTLTFRPDGTVEPIDVNNSPIIIYIAEGATNAEEEETGSQLKELIPDETTRFAIQVFPLTGEVEIKEVQIN